MMSKYYILVILTSLLLNVASAFDLFGRLHYLGPVQYYFPFSIKKGSVFAITRCKHAWFHDNLNNQGDICVSSANVTGNSFQNDGNFLLSDATDLSLTDFSNNGFFAMRDTVRPIGTTKLFAKNSFINLGIIHIETILQHTLGTGGANMLNRGTIVLNGGNHTLRSSLVGGGCLALLKQEELHIDISTTVDNLIYLDSANKEIHFSGMPNLIGLPMTFSGFTKNHDLYFHGSQTSRTHLLVGSYSPLTGTLVIITTPKPFSGAYDILTRSIYIGFGYDMFRFNFEFMTYRGLPVVHITYNKQGPNQGVPHRCRIDATVPNFEQCVSSAGPGTTYVSGTTPTPISTISNSANTRSTSTVSKSTATGLVSSADLISSVVTSSADVAQTTTPVTTTADLISSVVTSSADVAQTTTPVTTTTDFISPVVTSSVVVAPSTTSTTELTSFKPSIISTTERTSTTTSRKPDATITERKR
ncbi:uncharacterized protein NDAI_0F04040 [Naumovozyma dairenensis CBS 421]|uniref:Hyphally-regulated cell wall protein N-terminal domain-containing protein n=1 Tax=Naumovozyma dairenensis (strain ATCC 10597 / BCRC 20456 / CBS 421 / NBRC 0211 / NRRL Y-12639) TaxID=1071378 RepID=G0WD61_NAUDC|nr:hypothetical protein NDAI_0F04040 [Naumovozyma dairenensis CBS 421]CCD25722.1 hypothetical protein NDAI_0F04040 [Naumovozyma dairenensis CBS 421]